MIKKLRPVLGVSGGAEDVHHHEVLDVVLFSPWLLQLVDIVPGLLKIKCQRYHKLYCQREVNCGPSDVAPNLIQGVPKKMSDSDFLVIAASAA